VVLHAMNRERERERNRERMDGDREGTLCGADLVIFLSQQNLLPAVKQQCRELSVTLMYQRTHDQGTAYVRQLQLRFHYSISLHTNHVSDSVPTQCTISHVYHPWHSAPCTAQCTISWVYHLTGVQSVPPCATFT